MRKTLSLLVACAAFSLPIQAHAAGTQIRIVGSSTVYPFVTVVAEAFGNSTEFKTPIVESTGTGGGFKLFCAGIGDSHPDLSNASRAIKESEKALCAKNGVKNITEIKIGFDGIVLANSKGAARFDLSKEALFMALAKQIPVEGKLVDNPNKMWSDIDSSLPNVKIEVYGPPTTSGTRDAFVELVMEPSCKNLPAFKAEFPDKKARKQACHLLREDGHYIEAGENDNLIVQKLQSNAKALGIFGFSFLDQNGDIVQGSLISGTEPTFENISDGTYGISRSLYVYVKDAHVGKTLGLQEFVSELVSDDAAGEYGYLTEKGLIPLPEADLKIMQERSDALIKSTAQ
ncbi:MAG: phosphate ABC transporter substrate-binding protein [Alphaproteobacteria bacterium]|nr:MAG: phosphate ABC transporter substrate-binding protein [Alphaproteobacteria bacterium]